MKGFYLPLAFFLVPSLYAMNDLIEVTVANNRNALLTKVQLNRLALSSTTLKNAAEDFNDKEYLPTYFPYIEDSIALESISTLLNDDGTPNREHCLAQTKGDWYKIIATLDVLNIQCFNSYISSEWEKAYSSPRLIKELLRNEAVRSFCYETLPLSFKSELAQLINQNTITALHRYTLQKKLPLDYQFNHHGGTGVNPYAIATTSNRVIFGSGDTLKIVSLETNSLLHTLKGHKRTIHSIAVSQDEQTILSGCFNNTLNVWDMATGSLKNTLQEYRGDNHTHAISSDGKTIVSSSPKGMIDVLDVTSGSRRLTFKGHNAIDKVAITSNRQLIVSAGRDDNMPPDRDGNIKIWDLKTSSLLYTLAYKKVDEGKPFKYLTVRANDGVTDARKLIPVISPYHQLVEYFLFSPLAISPHGETIVSFSSLENNLAVWKSNISPELKKYLSQVPLEQALVIQALRTRPNRQKPFKLTGKPYEYFQQLRPDAQEFLCKELNIQQSFFEKIKRTLQR